MDLGPVVSGKTPGSEEAGRLEQEEGWGPEFHPGELSPPGGKREPFRIASKSAMAKQI